MWPNQATSSIPNNLVLTFFILIFPQRKCWLWVNPLFPWQKMSRLNGSSSRNTRRSRRRSQSGEFDLCVHVDDFVPCEQTHFLPAKTSSSLPLWKHLQGSVHSFLSRVGGCGIERWVLKYVCVCVRERESVFVISQWLKDVFSKLKMIINEIFLNKFKKKFLGLGVVVGYWSNHHSEHSHPFPFSDCFDDRVTRALFSCGVGPYATLGCCCFLDQILVSEEDWWGGLYFNWGKKRSLSSKENLRTTSPHCLNRKEKKNPKRRRRKTIKSSLFLSVTQFLIDICLVVSGWSLETSFEYRRCRKILSFFFTSKLLKDKTEPQLFFLASKNTGPHKTTKGINKPDTKEKKLQVLSIWCNPSSSPSQSDLTCPTHLPQRHNWPRS